MKIKKLQYKNSVKSPGITTEGTVSSDSLKQRPQETQDTPVEKISTVAGIAAEYASYALL